MSLYKFSQFAGAPNKMHQRQRAVIYDNNDPEKLGRVRVTIPGIFEEADKGKHPWIYPHDSYHNAGNDKTANVNVPRIGSTLNVEFHGGSAYHGVYTGTYRNQNNVNNKPFEENYPNVYGTVDHTGNQTLHDTKNHTFTYNHYAIDDTQSDSNNEENSSQPPDDENGNPKASHSYGKDGSISTGTQGNHTTTTQKDSTHTIGGSYSKTSSGDMTHQTNQTMTQKASSNITNSAGSDIVHKASKIFLN